MEQLDSLAVANWFIDTAKANGQPITAMKLQKLVYFAHGWHLALYEKALVNEKVEAWRWGPVFRDIYDAAKQFGSEPIVSRLSSNDECPLVQARDNRTPLLQRIWAVYGKYSASQLSKMTHEENGPWDITWKQDPGRRNMDIADELIKSTFKAKLQANSQ